MISICFNNFSFVAEIKSGITPLQVALNSLHDPHLRHLGADLLQFNQKAYSTNTLKSYESHLGRYRNWAVQHGIQIDVLPYEPIHLALFF